MKDTGINMECGACGKPISLTAKFCGKCGSPVKRPTATQSETSSTPLFENAPVEIPAQPESQTAEAKPVNEVQDLVLTLDIPAASAEHASMLEIDLNLVEPVNTEVHIYAPEKQIPATAPPVEPTAQVVNQDWLERWEHANELIQQKLEKHSQLLDFISLNSQQLSHFQTLPNPAEDLLRRLIDSQGHIAAQLTELQNGLKDSTQPVVLKLPDEFKLSLEKQKIELQKYFSQNVAQNTANIESTSQQTLARIEALMAEHSESAKKMENHITPLSQSVAELKSKLQDISKKQELAASKTSKIQNQSQDDSTEGSGGFIIFIIGLLCGLTLVLSSLAIYNFLSRDIGTPVKSAHDSAAPEAEHDKGAHEAPAHGDAAKPSSAHEEPAHGAASSHDKPASDSSKAKSH